MYANQAIPPAPDGILDPLPRILLAGSMNLMAGASGIGKTALLSWLIRQFETGQPIFGHATNPPPAIGYLAADRSWRGNGHWFQQSGVQTLRIVSLVDDSSIKLPNQRMKHQRVDFFKTCVAKLQLPPGSLLFVDPIALFLGGNLLDYDSVAFACLEIQRWLQDPALYYCTIGVCHTAKQKADKGDRYLRLQDRISGTMAQSGFTGTQMALAGPEETGDKDNRYTFHWNPHTAKPETFKFHKGENGLFLMEGATLVGPSIPPVEEEESAYPAGMVLPDFDQQILASIPPDQPISTHALIQLGDGTAAARRRIFRVLTRLIAAGLVLKLEYGLYQRGIDAQSPAQTDQKTDPETSPK